MSKYYIFYNGVDKTIIGFNHGPALKDNYLIIDSNDLELFDEIINIDAKIRKDLQRELKEKFKYHPNILFNKINNINNFIKKINSNNNKRLPIIYDGGLRQINNEKDNMIDYEIIDYQINRICIRLKKLPFQLENNGDRDIIIERMLNNLNLDNKSFENYLIKILYTNTNGLTFEDIKNAYNNLKKDNKKGKLSPNIKTIKVKDSAKQLKKINNPKTLTKKRENNYGYTDIIFLLIVLISSIIFAINMAYILVK